MATKRTRTPGRPKRDLIKISLSMNINSLALAEKIAEEEKKARILVMEEAISEYAEKRGFTMTDAEARGMLGIEPEAEAAT